MSTIHKRTSHSEQSHPKGGDASLTMSKKEDAGTRITRLGLYSNLGMAIVKGVGGYTFNSQAMLADAWHSLTDIASDLLTLATVSWSSKPPTASFPTGFGKIESLGALGVSGMLLIGGSLMCFNSCNILYAHFFLDSAAQAAAHAHAHAHGAVDGPSLHAAWLALGTVLLKEWLYHATMRIAKKTKSSVLASNAIHHRIDSLTGVVTLFAILGANFLSEATWLDPVGGFLISLLVIKGGWGNTVSALSELADKGIENDIKDSVRHNLQKALEKLHDGSKIELREVGGVKSGQNYLVDLQLAVPSTWTVEELSKIENELREILGPTVQGLRRIKFRFVPSESKSNLLDEFIPPSSNQDVEDNDVYIIKNTIRTGNATEHSNDKNLERDKGAKII
ncbi:hypothetical protein K3495_g6868 [Podosphaera aphanis]|nr:hypothetical protein K3495_g6868 [Podosphaera aphanis]